jgi:antitoxin component YwqK of YwqJK toxin-antitoxin module
MGNIIKNTNKNNEVTYVHSSYNNGQIRGEIWYLNGVKHTDDDAPAHISYYENGNVYIKIWYKNGKMHRDNYEPAFIVYYDDGVEKEKNGIRMVNFIGMMAYQIL